MKRYIIGVLSVLVLAHASLMADEKAKSVEYNPFKEVQQMQQEMDAVFDKFQKRMLHEKSFSQFDSALPAMPAVDLKDVGDAYQLKADIPGSDKDAIKITTKDGMLKIEAKSEKAKEEKDKDFLKKERFVGSYLRMVSLPKDADATKLKSQYKNGVLEVTIPKKK